jgi:RNase P subunit RPR2
MKWMQLSRREDLRNKSAEYLYVNCRLCEKHFENSQFYNAATKTKLLPYAVPTLFDVPNPPRLISSSRRTLCKRCAPQATLVNVKRRKRSRGNILAFVAL